MKSDIKALCFLYCLAGCICSCGIGQIFTLCGNLFCNFGAIYSCHSRERLRRRFDLPPAFCLPPGIGMSLQVATIIDHRPNLLYLFSPFERNASNLTANESTFNFSVVIDIQSKRIYHARICTLAQPCDVANVNERSGLIHPLVCEFEFY